jgi:hypothetical protein
MARWVTAEKLAEIGALANLPEEEVDAVITAAGKLYDEIRAEEWITDGDLRARAETLGIPVDTATAALNMLREEGRVKRVAARATAAVTAEPVAAPGPTAVAEEPPPKKTQPRRARKET